MAFKVIHILSIVVVGLLRCVGQLNGEEMVIKEELPNGLISYSLETGLSEHSTLTLFVKLPEASDGATVRCFHYCSWEKDPVLLQKALLDESVWPSSFAAGQNLAVVTWGTERLRNLGDRDGLVTSRLDAIALCWNRVFLYLAADLGLKTDQSMGYGVSRGVTYIQAIALRYPDCFVALHLHVGGFYECPSIDNRLPIYLVTTGNYDNNRNRCFSFYERLKKLGFHPLFKSFENHGHESSDYTIQISRAFFDYVLGLGHMGCAPVNRQAAFNRHMQVQKASLFLANEKSNERALRERNDVEVAKGWQVLPSDILYRLWIEERARRTDIELATPGAFLDVK